MTEKGISWLEPPLGNVNYGGYYDCNGISNCKNKEGPKLRGAAKQYGNSSFIDDDDFDKLLQLLKERVEKLKSNDHSNKEGHWSTETALPYDNCDDNRRRQDNEDRSLPSISCAEPPGNGS